MLALLLELEGTNLMTAKCNDKNAKGNEELRAPCACTTNLLSVWKNQVDASDASSPTLCTTVRVFVAQWQCECACVS